MSSPFKKALLRGAAAALVIPAALNLTACASPSGGDDVKSALSSLRTTLESISGVEEARVAGSFDGSPDRRKLGVTVYVTDMSVEAVTPIVEQALQQAWAFDAFVPVGYSIQVWPSPVPSPPANADTMFDIEQIQSALELTGGFVYNRALSVGPDVLEAKFGARG
ncbi:hypothetical protein D6T64_10490 [Cryobacterium melibiosiphilum]|uniref:Uncharacterized protein n=1 Tax=Cryobacterium melibiosiphilum TaxID=995039 RepID=A0A3A5MRA8_9MICO|nr:hypothetical protein [Cryobacterium melibiosiphilum]RJT88546.1 hypothetical protein D6T64_10490 [Cryobacterium melibiosiphilum]